MIAEFPLIFKKRSMSRDFPPPPSTEQQVQLAIDELIATAQALINLGAPTLSPETLHEWLDSPDELLGFPTKDRKLKT
jgi:hypothetical protein